LDAGVEAEKHQRKIGDSLFCGPFHSSRPPFPKNNSPKAQAAGLETDVKTFFNCTRRFHVLSEFFHKNGVVIQNFLV
jgi:hypothetical protein